MKMSRNILLFCVAIFVSLLVTGSAYTVMSGEEFGEDFIVLLVMNFPVCVLIGLIDWLVVFWLGSLLPPGRDILNVMVNIAVTSAVCFMLVVGLNLIFGDSPLQLTMRFALCSLPWNLIVVMMLEAQHHSRQRAIMAREKAVFQLAVLKQQLNPHFLFNSLNTLASLAYTDAALTNRFAKTLSGVYRYLLETQSVPLVALTKELAFVDKYISLEKIRFGNSLDITIRRECEPREALVVPSAIQLVVENAIKHNVCSEQTPLVIEAVIMADCVEITNILNPRTSVDSYGVGLKNISQQYRLHNKDISYCSRDDRFVVRLPFIKS